MIVIPADKEVDFFVWTDIYHAIKEANLILKKNRIKQHTYEGLSANVKVLITDRKNIHIDWSKK